MLKALDRPCRAAVLGMGKLRRALCFIHGVGLVVIAVAASGSRFRRADLHWLHRLYGRAASHSSQLSGDCALPGFFLKWSARKFASTSSKRIR